MNKFDQVFFKSYIPEWVTILDIAHRHIIVIIGQIIINYFFWVLLPTFIYYNSLTIQSYIPFFVLEIFIILVFFKNIFDILDWYNDVWIITDEWVTELHWEVFSSNSTSVKYNSIEWLEILQNGIIDTFLGKWDIIIHKIGWENNFLLRDAQKWYQILEMIDVIQKKVKEQYHKELEENQDKNFETILKALGEVVESYMGKNGFEKDESEENIELIEKLKKSKHTIDLSE